MTNRRLAQFSASVALALAAVFSAPAIAAPWFSSLVPSLKRQTSVPILLPSSLAPVWQNAYADGKGNKDGYVIYLGNVPDCNGTTACTVGYLTASKQERNLTGQKVKLANGVTGFFKPKNCPGRGCYKASLSWVYRNVAYSLSALSDQAPLVRLANSAITSGPR